MQRIAVIIAIVTATVILPVAAQAQTKDDLSTGISMGIAI